MSMLRTCRAMASNTSSPRCRSVLLRKHATSMPHTTVAGEIQVKSLIVPAARHEEESKSEGGDEQEVENAEEDEHGVDADDVGPVRDGKGDDVEEPEEDCPAGKHGVVLGQAESLGGGRAFGENLVGEHEEGDGAEDEESPLV